MHLRVLSPLLRITPAVHAAAAHAAAVQFVLEALVIPPEAPSSASEIAQTVPPTLKLLRSIKFCEDACEAPGLCAGGAGALLVSDAAAELNNRAGHGATPRHMEQRCAGALPPWVSPAWWTSAHNLAPRACPAAAPAAPDPHTGSAHQLCDIALALVRALEIRAAKGNPQEVRACVGERPALKVAMTQGGQGPVLWSDRRGARQLASMFAPPPLCGASH